MTRPGTTSKSTLRLTARARRTGLAARLPDFAEKLACFAGDLPLVSASVVASYWPLRDEADPRPLAAALASRGHTILLPCIGGKDETLSFRQWREGDAMKIGPFGVSEPLRDAPLFEPSVVLVPLLVFDSLGHRLGYGGGYYDRTLAALRTRGPILAIGVAYSGQGLDRPLDNDPHDQKLDMIITEIGVRRF